MTADLTEKRTRALIKNKATNGPSNERGTVAMARTNVVDKIAAVPTDTRGPHADVPVEPMVIQAVTVQYYREERNSSMRRGLLRACVVLLAVSLGPGVTAQDAPPNPKVVIETTEGDITIELFRADAPASVVNLLMYVRDGYYEKDDLSPRDP